jgi:hypothetical protein
MHNGNVIRERVCKADDGHRFFSEEAMIGHVNNFVKKYNAKGDVESVYLNEVV